MRRIASVIGLFLFTSILAFGQSSEKATATIKGRTVMGTIPKPNNKTQAQGVVVVQIQVNQYGNVIDAVPGAQGTTITDRSLWESARDAAYKTHFSMDPNASTKQSGTIAFTFDGSYYEEYTKVKELVEEKRSGVFTIRARFVRVHDSTKLVFLVEEDEYIIPIKLVKKDLGAENRFRSMNLQKGDSLTITGRLTTISVDYEDYKGLDEATIVDHKEGKRHKDYSESETPPPPPKFVEIKPSFNGGDVNEFSKWVNSHLVYPEVAKENGVQGRVTVQFTVEDDGRVTNVTVLRGVNPALDAEAKRVVSSSPKWKPGRSQGKAVPITMTFPVIFQLR